MNGLSSFIEVTDLFPVPVSNDHRFIFQIVEPLNCHIPRLIIFPLYSRVSLRQQDQVSIFPIVLLANDLFLIIIDLMDSRISICQHNLRPVCIKEPLPRNITAVIIFSGEGMIPSR